MSNDLLFQLLEQIDPDEEFDEVEEERREKVLREMGKERRRKERREKRRDDCGNWSYWYSPHTGKQASFAFRCELFRECLSCLEHRAEREYNWLRDAVLEKSLKVLHIDSEKITKLLRKAKVDKSLYVRYPQENGTDILIVEESAGVGGDVIDLHWVYAQDWETLTNTPEGRNKSGTVHIPVSDDDMSEFTLITTKQFTTSATRHQTLVAMRTAEKRTTELDPKTPDQVVKALNKRVNIATHLLKQEGFTVQVYDKRLKVEHDRIDWQVESDGRIFRVNTNINTEKSDNSLPMRLKQPQELINSP